MPGEVQQSGWGEINIRELSWVAGIAAAFFVIAAGLWTRPEWFAGILALFCPDGVLEDLGRWSMTALKYFSFTMVFLLGNYIVMKRFRTLEDVNMEMQGINRTVFYLANILGLYLFLSFAYNLGLMYETKEMSPLYREDGFFENMTTVFLLAASIIMLMALLKFVKSVKKRSKYCRIAMIFFVFLTLAFFWAGMEEISWGQRIFGWETPEAIAELNMQEETNLHNFINPIIPLLNDVFTIGMAGVFLLSMWLNFIGSRWYFWRLILPHPSTIAIAGLIVVSRFPFDSYFHEMLEELISVLAVLYSLRVHYVAKYGLLSVLEEGEAE